jgi:hypothetical protein
LPSLQHIRLRRSTGSRVLPARCVPSSGFPDPLDGFLPSRPCRLCFAPAALLGFSLRSFLLWRGIRHVSTRMRPHTVSTSVIPAAKRLAGTEARGSWVFTLARVPCPRRRVLTCREPDAPLGFALLGFADNDLRQAFARRPLLRFAAKQCHAAGASEFQSIAVWSSHVIHGKPGAATTTLSGFLHLVGPNDSGTLPAGLCVRLTPCGTSLSTLGDLWLDPCTLP